MAGGLIKGLSEKNVLHLLLRWPEMPSYYIVASRQGNVFEVYTGLGERMGSLYFIGASIMYGSTYNPIKSKLLKIF